MNGPRLRWLLSAVLTALLCVVAGAQAGDPPRPEVVLIGCVPQFTWTPLVVAQERKFFQDENLDVRVLVFPNARAMANAFCQRDPSRRPHTQLSASRVGDLVFWAAQEYPVSLVCEVAASRGMDKIIVKPAYKGLDDPALRGKRIACELRTMSHYFLTAALRQLNLSLKDYELTDMAGQEAATAFARGTVDVAVTWEPAATLAHGRGGGKTAFTTAELRDGMPECLCAQDYVIQRYPDIVVKVLRCWLRAQQWGQANEEEYMSIARRKLFFRSRVDDKALRYYRDLVTFHSPDEIRARMADNGPLYAYCQDVLRFYQQIGEIRESASDLAAHLRQGLMIDGKLFKGALPGAGK